MQLQEVTLNPQGSILRILSEAFRLEKSLLASKKGNLMISFNKLVAPVSKRISVSSIELSEHDHKKIVCRQGYGGLSLLPWLKLMILCMSHTVFGVTSTPMIKLYHHLTYLKKFPVALLPYFQHGYLAKLSS